MNYLEYHRLALIEKQHWWYRSIHRLIFETLRKQRPKRLNSAPLHIVDAGCGTGGLTERMKDFGVVIGVDISDTALSFGRAKGLTLVQGSVNALPIREKSADIILSVSVLYHQLVNDLMAMKEMYRILTLGGIGVIILPAFQGLLGMHDRNVHTRRRYSIAEATQLSREAGLHVVSSGYVFSLLFPIFALRRLFERFFSFQLGSEVSIPIAPVNWLLERVCRIEWKLRPLVKFPFGSSLMLVVKKL